jgi:hypothetical protein
MSEPSRQRAVACDSAQPGHRDTSALSVVVASFRERAVLDACLASLQTQCTAAGAELIVARADSPERLDAIRAAFPDVLFVAAPPGTDIPRLRGAGLGAARGELALLTEDHCVADASWVATMSRHATGDADVVGGSMDNARRARALDWGAFFAEYGFFSAMSHIEGAPLPLITGANVAYSRRVLPDVVAWTTAGAWENVVHDRLREAGTATVFEPLGRVAQNLEYQFSTFALDRYQHGHDYARVRLAENPSMNRWTRLPATFLLPPLLTWRVARTAVGSFSRATAFARALPFTLAFFTAWAVGEAVGYLRGPMPSALITDVK